MPYDRKYSRSRSPVDDRTNRRKHDSYDRDRHSPISSSRSRQRSIEGRSSVSRRDDRRDERRHRDSERVRTERSDRHRRSDSLSRYASRDDHDERGERVRRERSKDRSRHSEHSARDRHDPNYGRLIPATSERSPVLRGSPPDGHELNGEGTRKRKMEESEQTRTTARDVKRSSRFDKPATNEPLQIGEDMKMQLPVIKSDLEASAPTSQASLGATTNNVTNSTQIQSTKPEDVKLRLRQARLAEWKKKKAEEEAKKLSEQSSRSSKLEAAESSQQNIMPQVIEAKPKNTTQVLTLGTPASMVRAFSRVKPIRSATEDSRKPHTAIGKFGMTTNKTLNNVTEAIPNRNLKFDDEDRGPRSAPNLGSIIVDNGMDPHIDRATSMADVINQNEVSEADEIDPLDAFMAENASALHETHSGSRSAADILNDHESDTQAEQSAEEDILAIAAKKLAQKKKEIVSIDHSRQDYEAFRKDFYVEPVELAGLSEEEVDAMRLELDGIVIRGKDCPKPITNWGQCGLSAPTLDQIQRLGYETPTSIQAQAIPAIMSGRDTIGVAKTGSGKTVAFLLPMFRHIKDQRPLENMDGPIALILTPTRELAVQIHKECKPFLKALDLRAVCIYGGPPIKDQIAELKRGAEIVVCTPGRMIDVLAANQGRVTNLHRVTYTVLDEADRMFDLGFEPQVMKIINNIRPQRQTVLFSATFPKSMEALARKILRGKPLEITVGARSVVAPEITQIVEVRPIDPDPHKFNRVLEILGDLYNNDEDARTLIFVDRQDAADSLLSQLMRKGYPCNALHAGKDQYDRESTISDFKAGIFPILVATSIAARGLDVKHLKLVINYDCPNHMEDYVHRVGRTGRAGNKGTAITFVGEDQERYAFDIAKALRLSQVEIPEPLKKLADAFASKVKSGQEKGTASGFGGKGLAKFDTARDQEKKLQRKLYGEDDDVEDEAVKARALELEEEDSMSVDEDRIDPEQVKAVAEHGTSAAADAPIKVERVTAQSKKPSTSKPNVGTKALDPVAAARARIDAINNRIKAGSKPLEQVASNPDAGEYRAMMEINDFPQKARWNVTNRTNIAKVLEATGTSITTQGQYVKPGSSAPVGVPKLYLLVEGPTEICVTDAVMELRRLLTEGTLADAESAGTRYKVV